MLIIKHDITPTMSNYLLVSIVGTNKGITILEHPVYGKYYCDHRGRLCFPDGQPWFISGWSLHQPGEELLELLKNTPNHEVYKVDEFYFTNRVHAEQYVKNEGRDFLVKNYAKSL